jgi:hypothetical protein
MLTSNQVIEDFKKRTKSNLERVKSNFSSLSENQFNWKPSTDVWSVGECINHLIVTNELYKVKIENLSTSAPGNTETDYTYSMSFMGKMIAKGVDPANVKKAKTFKVFSPKKSSFQKSVVESYIASSDKLIDLVSRMRNFDLKKLRLSSPVSALIRLNLGDPLIIIPKHDERHIIQAERLIKTESFPKE